MALLLCICYLDAYSGDLSKVLFPLLLKVVLHILDANTFLLFSIYDLFNLR